MIVFGHKQKVYCISSWIQIRETGITAQISVIHPDVRVDIAIRVYDPVGILDREYITGQRFKRYLIISQFFHNTGIGYQIS